MAKSLDETVEAFRSRPLDQGPYAYLWVDALVLKSREVGGRAHIAGVTALIATAVNAQGYREILGLDVVTSEDGAGWLAFFRSMVARGLSGVELVISDAHEGLKAAIGDTSGCRLAEMPDAFREEPAHQGAPRVAGVGGHGGAFDLRPA